MDEFDASPFSAASRHLPPLQRVSRVAFAAEAMTKEEPLGSLFAMLRAEVTELERAPDQTREAELGDVLFSVLQLAARLQLDPEKALEATLTRFQDRFDYIVRKLGDSSTDWKRAPRAELARLWNEAKASSVKPRLPRVAFLSAPITGMRREECIQYYRAVASLIARMRENWKLDDVYCAALALVGGEAPETPAAAMQTVRQKIDGSDLLILLWHDAIVTSALIEVGYAFARDVPVICMHREQAALPFLLSEDSADLRRFSYRSHEELERWIASTTLAEILPV